MKKWLYLILFATICSVFLISEMTEVIEETSVMTPFYWSVNWLNTLTSKAGWLLIYLSSMLCAYSNNPLIGVFLLTIVLMLLGYGLSYLLDLSGTIEPIVWIPSCLLLLNFTQLGYMLYVMKVFGQPFLLPLGFLFILSCIKIWNSISSWLIRDCVAILIGSIGYLLFGFFALYSLFVLLIVELTKVVYSGTKSGHLNQICTLTIIICSALLFPWLFYVLGVVRMRLESIYFAALPDYQTSTDEIYLWCPIIISLLIVLLLVVYSQSLFLKTCISHNKKAMARIEFVFCFVLLIGAGYSTYHFTYRDENFISLLKMKHAVDDADWEKVRLLGHENVETPTRLQVLFQQLALQKMGKGGDSLFTVTNSDEPYHAFRNQQYLRLIGGRALYYYYGKINYSYRWCMEDMVEYGMRPDYLKYMSLCALVNQEMTLAKKYLTALEASPAGKDFAKYYKPYIENTNLLEQDSVMSSIRRLMNYNDLLDGDGGLIEVYLLNSFALMEGGTQEMVDLSLQSNLILKDISGFWPRFFKLLPAFKGKIPRHYQEAALLFSTLEHNIDISKLPIDSQIQEKFQNLIEESSQNSDRGDEYNRMSLKPTYGDTYWYYYFFVTNLKTN